MLIAIIPYYNPFKWKIRLKNYNTCVSRLRSQGCKVITVECAIGDKIYETDAEMKVFYTYIIWQKERLINLAVERLPSCDNIIWLDNDLIFSDENWVEKTEELLKINDYVQLFEKVVYLYPGSMDVKDGVCYQRHSQVYSTKSNENLGALLQNENRLTPNELLNSLPDGTKDDLS